MGKSYGNKIPAYLSLPMLLFAWCCPILHGATSEPPSLGALATAIQTQERTLLNVEIKGFKSRVEVRPPSSADWHPTDRVVEGNAWYNGLRDSKARIQITRRVIEWEKGAYPWMETQEDLGYDGKFGYAVRLAVGPPGHVRRNNRAQILATKPLGIADRFQRFADGTGFSLFYYEQINKPTESFSELLAGGVAKGVPWRTDWESVGDTQAIKLTFANSSTAFVGYWFDPARGYALIKVEKRYRTGVLDDWEIEDLTEVKRLVEAAPAIWFPVEAVHTERDLEKQGGLRRIIFHADGVVVNNPAFDDSIFTVPIPDGFWVANDVLGQSYRTADPQRIAAATDNIVKQIKTELRVGRPLATAPLPSPTPVVTRSHLRYWLVLTGIGIGLIAGLLFGFRKLRLRQNVLLMIALTGAGMLASTIAHAQANGMPATAPSGPKHLNCGLGVTYFTVAWFVRPTSTTTLARELNIGDFFERRCSLKEIRDVLIGHDLQAVGKVADHPVEILQSSPTAKGGICTNAILLRLETMR